MLHTTLMRYIKIVGLVILTNFFSKQLTPGVQLGKMKFPFTPTSNSNTISVWPGMLFCEINKKSKYVVFRM